MPTKFHRRVRRILEQAIRYEPEIREVFIQRACGRDTEMLQEVRSLLPHFEVMRDFEPERPQDSKWMLPGTTTFTQARDEAIESERERDPPFMIDHYTVLEVLGRGGMGVVYRAVHPTLHRQVAVKVLRRGILSNESRRRFTFEEEILRQLQHPDIARFVHSGVARPMPIETAAGLNDWRPYFVMEYIDGRPLTRFAHEQSLDSRQRLDLMVRICDAIEYAHHRGIIHRDLKPDNILVTSGGDPKILDFGIAHIPLLQSAVVRDRDGHFTGTFQYASPEQIAGKIDNLTPRSDVFTLGLILHELLTGRLPKRTPTGLRLNLKNVRLPESPEEGGSGDKEFRYYLTAVLATALRQTEGEYYNSAGDLQKDIEELQAHFPAKSRWAWLKSIGSYLFTPRASSTPASTQQPLRAVLRKRISMAMESGAYRTPSPDEKTDDTDVPPENPATSESTIPFVKEDTVRLEDGAPKDEGPA